MLPQCLTVAALLLWTSAMAFGQTDGIELRSANPPNRQACASQCDRDAVIFVHGLWGNDTTWKNPQASKAWPELLLSDPRFARFDAYYFGYPTSLGFWNKGNNIRLTPLAKRFADTLIYDIFDRYQRVHLIGHSLGGNVILTSFLFVKFQRRDAHALLSKIRSINLLGTPVRGSDIARLGTFVSSDQKLIALRPVVENELPVLIEFALQAIDGKRVIFGETRLPIFAAFETMPLYGSIIVTENSAAAVGGIGAVKGFERNHETLVKPLDTDDAVYKWVAPHLLRRF